MPSSLEGQLPVKSFVEDDAEAVNRRFGDLPGSLAGDPLGSQAARGCRRASGEAVEPGEPPGRLAQDRVVRRGQSRSRTSVTSVAIDPVLSACWMASAISATQRAVSSSIGRSVPQHLIQSLPADLLLRLTRKTPPRTGAASRGSAGRMAQPMASESLASSSSACRQRTKQQ